MKLINIILEHMLLRNRYKYLSKSLRYSNKALAKKGTSKQYLEQLNYFISKGRYLYRNEINEYTIKYEHSSQISNNYYAKAEICKQKIEDIDKKLDTLRIKST